MITVPNNRITPDIIEELVRQHPEVRLATNTFLDYGGCDRLLDSYCPIGALWWWSEGEPRGLNPIHVRGSYIEVDAKAALGAKYVEGFINGFDGRYMCRTDPLESPLDAEHRAGFWDGWACRMHFNFYDGFEARMSEGDDV